LPHVNFVNTNVYAACMSYSCECEPVSRSIRRRGAAGLIVAAAVLVVAGCFGTSDASSSEGILRQEALALQSKENL